MTYQSSQSPNATALVAFGDDKASQWESVALRYRAPLRGFFARRVRNAADVDDLVQEVFLRLIGRVQGGPIEKVEQYLFQSAANVLRDSGRRSSVREADAHESFDEMVHEFDTDITPERVLLGKESVALVVVALKQLPERTRDIFVLRALEQRKYADIATLLHISTRAVEQHMSRALAHLGRALES